MAIAGDNVGRRRRALMSLGERARGPPEAKAGRGAFGPAKPEMWPLAFCLQHCASPATHIHFTLPPPPAPLTAAAPTSGTGSSPAPRPPSPPACSGASTPRPRACSARRSALAPPPQLLKLRRVPLRHWSDRPGPGGPPAQREHRPIPAADVRPAKTVRQGHGGNEVGTGAGRLKREQRHAQCAVEAALVEEDQAASLHRDDDLLRVAFVALVRVGVGVQADVTARHYPKGRDCAQDRR